MHLCSEKFSTSGRRLRSGRDYRIATCRSPCFRENVVELGKFLHDNDDEVMHVPKAVKKALAQRIVLFASCLVRMCCLCVLVRQMSGMLGWSGGGWLLFCCLCVLRVMRALLVGRLVFLSLSLLFLIVLFRAKAPKSFWAKASLRRVQTTFAAEEKRLAGR